MFKISSTRKSLWVETETRLQAKNNGNNPSRGLEEVFSSVPQSSATCRGLFYITVPFSQKFSTKIFPIKSKNDRNPATNKRCACKYTCVRAKQKLPCLSPILLWRHAWTLSSAQGKTKGCKFAKDVCIQKTRFTQRCDCLWKCGVECEGYWNQNYCAEQTTAAAFQQTSFPSREEGVSLMSCSWGYRVRTKLSIVKSVAIPNASVIIAT